MISETCSCGAAIEFDAYSTVVEYVVDWRENHKYEGAV